MKDSLSNPHIEIQVELIPSKSKLKAEAKVQIERKSKKDSTLDFKLNRGCNVRNILDNLRIFLDNLFGYNTAEAVHRFLSDHA